MSIPNNYIPIKLLSTVGKVFERILCLRIKTHVEENVISKTQAGFHNKFSCLEQIIFSTEKLHIAIKNMKNSTGIFLDISKAFDRVWQKGLLHKMYTQIGIRGNFFLTLVDYFQQRTCKVKINNSFSYVFKDDIGTSWQRSWAIIVSYIY